MKYGRAMQKIMQFMMNAKCVLNRWKSLLIFVYLEMFRGPTTVWTQYTKSQKCRLHSTYVGYTCEKTFVCFRHRKSRDCISNRPHSIYVNADMHKIPVCFCWSHRSCCFAEDDVGRLPWILSGMDLTRRPPALCTCLGQSAMQFDRQSAEITTCFREVSFNQ